jgi:hypothetical protein
MKFVKRIFCFRVLGVPNDEDEVNEPNVRPLQNELRGTCPYRRSPRMLQVSSRVSRA